MNKNERIIDQLFVLARDREKVYRAKIVAAVVHKGKIISYGFNQNRTSWMQRQFKKNEHAMFLHAEVDAIKNALKVIDAEELKSASLYVVRSKNKGGVNSRKGRIGGKEVYGNAEPCTGCKTCIKWFGIDKIYHTTEDESFKRMEIE